MKSYIMLIMFVLAFLAKSNAEEKRKSNIKFYMKYWYVDTALDTDGHHIIYDLFRYQRKLELTEIETRQINRYQFYTLILWIVKDERIVIFTEVNIKGEAFEHDSEVEIDGLDSQYVIYECVPPGASYLFNGVKHKTLRVEILEQVDKFKDDDVDAIKKPFNSKVDYEELKESIRKLGTTGFEFFTTFQMTKS